jgi:hypothetical protein
MKKILLVVLSLLILFVLCSIPSEAQTTPNLNLNVPPYATQNWNTLMNQNFNSLDSYLGGSIPFPSALQTNITGTAGGLSTNISESQVTNLTADIAGLTSDVATKAPFVSPSFTTPDLGTPTFGVITNLTGTCTSCSIGGNAATATNIGSASPVQGDILYYSGTTWANLGHGTTGYVLTTQGASANPIWAISGTVTTTGFPTIGNLAVFSSSTSINGVTALPNGTTATTQSKGDGSTKIASTAYVDANTVGGSGQAWTNVSGSRVIGTAYTNSTGRPIQVNVFLNNSGLGSGFTATMTSGSVTVSEGQMGLFSDESTFGIMLSAIIPNGASYQVNMVSGTISFWSELR